MTTKAIEVSELGKQYQLGERDQYQTVRDVLSNGAAAAGRRVRRKQPVGGAPHPGVRMWNQRAPGGAWNHRHQRRRKALC